MIELLSLKEWYEKQIAPLKFPIKTAICPHCKGEVFWVTFGDLITAWTTHVCFYGQEDSDEA